MTRTDIKIKWKYDQIILTRVRDLLTDYGRTHYHTITNLSKECSRKRCWVTDVRRAEEVNWNVDCSNENIFWHILWEWTCNCGDNWWFRIIICSKLATVPKTRRKWKWVVGFLRDPPRNAKTLWSVCQRPGYKLLSWCRLMWHYNK